MSINYIIYLAEKRRTSIYVGMHIPKWPRVMSKTLTYHRT